MKEVSEISCYILFYGLKDLQRSVYTFSEEKSLVVFKDETSVTLDQKQNQVQKQQRDKVESYHEAGCVGGREAP